MLAVACWTCDFFKEWDFFFSCHPVSSWDFLPVQWILLFSKKMEVWHRLEISLKCQLMKLEDQLKSLFPPKYNGWEEPTWFHKQNMWPLLLKLESTFHEINPSNSCGTQITLSPFVSFQILIGSLNLIFQSSESSGLLLTANADMLTYYMMMKTL